MQVKITFFFFSPSELGHCLCRRGFNRRLISDIVDIEAVETAV
jgi:hypothetical protein